MSEAPPAGNGTMMVILRSGYSARAGAAASMSTARAERMLLARNFMDTSLKVVGQACHLAPILSTRLANLLRRLSALERKHDLSNSRARLNDFVSATGFFERQNLIDQNLQPTLGCNL